MKQKRVDYDLFMQNQDDMNMVIIWVKDKKCFYSWCQISINMKCELAYCTITVSMWKALFSFLAGYMNTKGNFLSRGWHHIATERRKWLEDRVIIEWMTVTFFRSVGKEPSSANSLKFDALLNVEFQWLVLHWLPKIHTDRRFVDVQLCWLFTGVTECASLLWYVFLQWQLLNESLTVQQHLRTED